MDGLAAVPLSRHQCPEAVIAMYSSDPAAASAALHQGADLIFAKTTDATAMLNDLVALARQRRAERSGRASRIQPQGGGFGAGGAGQQG